DSADFDRILEREEYAFACALLRIHIEQILAVILYCAGEHGIRRMTGEHLRECTLARAVRTHDRVHFPGAERESDALQALSPRYVFCPRPAEIPFDTIVERVFLPR